MLYEDFSNYFEGFKVRQAARNVKYNVIDFDDAKYISEENYQEFIKRGKPELNDVLLTKGGTTGIAHCVSVEKEFAVWVHVALLKVIKEYVDPKYLRDVLSADFVYRQSQDQTHGIGNQDLGLTRMIYMALTLPPFEEQQEIVRRVEKLFALADSLEAKYKKAIQRVEKIEQSILVKAFKGELADPDPNDEPAAELLNRILQEKAKLESTKKPRSNRSATPSHN